MREERHAEALVGVFREWGLDPEVVQTGNNLWVVTITREDGQIVCVNDDAVGLYDNESDF